MSQRRGESEAVLQRTMPAVGSCWGRPSSSQGSTRAGAKPPFQVGKRRPKLEEQGKCLAKVDVELEPPKGDQMGGVGVGCGAEG